MVPSEKTQPAARKRSPLPNGVHAKHVPSVGSTAKAVNGEASALVPGPTKMPSPAAGVRMIAFYLPQYHPIPENDRWWGKGFTEWTSVVGAKPFFRDHEQPQLPADLGFYDLRLAETRESQATLAREYGIHGFCYYYYWFSGRKLLDTPISEVVRTGRPDFPFCICWANEPWSRRWDGSDQEVLIAQEHDPVVDEGFIRDVLPMLQDPRYIRINGAPLLLIYRVGLLPAPHELFRAWRRIAAEHGIDGLHICIAETFGSNDPYRYGADSSVIFPPHGVWAGAINDKIDDLRKDYAGSIYDYRDVVLQEITRPKADYLRFRSAMPAWDNTPRRGLSGNIFAYSSPDQYELWLRALIQDAAARSVPDERLVFVNAWNEWGEGAHLEPDHRYGRLYLEATRRALSDQSDWRVAIAQLEALQGEEFRVVHDVAASLRQRLLALETANKFLVSRIETQAEAGEIAKFEVGMLYRELPHETGAIGYLEQINRYNLADETPVLRRDYPVLMKGWCFVPGQEMTPDAPLFITLSAEGDPRVYTCAIDHREERRDVSEFHNATRDEAFWSGFLLNSHIANVEPGCYHVSINVVLKDRVVRYDTNREIFIL
jgi:hypothetical protein